jgi:hypothetical protein
MNRASFLLLPAAAAARPANAQDPAMPEALLQSAHALVDHLWPANNVYGSHPTYVQWADPVAGTPARNRSVCSSFATRLLEHSFGYTQDDIATWFGKRVPQAREYHDTILARTGFLRIVHMSAIRPGDILAVKYPDGSHPTGHVMIVASLATPGTATNPVQPATQQYELRVVDSANTGHGTSDTRYRREGKPEWVTGAGEGVLRLYARPDDTIAGYAWSTSPKSLFRAAQDRAPAIGRLDPARAPKPSGTPATSARGDDPESNGDDAPFDDAQ